MRKIGSTSVGKTPLPAQARVAEETPSPTELRVQIDSPLHTVDGKLSDDRNEQAGDGRRALGHGCSWVDLAFAYLANAKTSLSWLLEAQALARCEQTGTHLRDCNRPWTIQYTDRSSVKSGQTCIDLLEGSSPDSETESKRSVVCRMEYIPTFSRFRLLFLDGWQCCLTPVIR